MMLCLKIYLVTIFFYIMMTIFNIIVRKYIFIFEQLVYNEIFKSSFVFDIEEYISEQAYCFGQSICKPQLPSA